MRISLFIFLAVFTFSCQTKEKEPEYDHLIKALDLVRLVEEGTLKDFTQFLETRGFRIYFSDTSNDGIHVRHQGKDSSGLNSINVSIENNLLVRSLNFTTDDKRLNDKIDEDLKKEGFYPEINDFEGRLVKKGSSVEISQWIGEGGGRVDYQVVINKRQ